MLKLASLWQREHGLRLDGILQCGDFGFFPDLGRLDRATVAHARHNPEELGFSRYFARPEPPERCPVVERILRGPPGDLRSLSAPIVWTHGNHEDFDALAEATGGRERAAVDAYGVFEHLDSGAITTVADLRVAAVGGAPERNPARASPPQFVDPAACRALARKRFDILITHGSMSGLGGESDDWGSRRLRRLVEAAQPPIHFYAHHREAFPITKVGRTRTLFLDDVQFRRQGRGRGPVNDCCMGILSWGRAGPAFDWVEPSWSRRVTPHTWREL